MTSSSDETAELVSITLNGRALDVPREKVEELREASAPIARLFGVRDADEARDLIPTEREISRIFSALESIDGDQAGA
ncbi:MAG TPA: hypothetical protein VJ204_05680 [Solirubrobacterales bacterium]|nr:hypothetical protein [Solirubrobacterales bacterium]